MKGRVKLRKRKLFAGSGTTVELEDIPVESDYKGPHIKLPMTLQNLQELIDGFKGKKVNIYLYCFSIHWLSCLFRFKKDKFYISTLDSLTIGIFFLLYINNLRYNPSYKFTSNSIEF